MGFVSIAIKSDQRRESKNGHIETQEATFTLAIQPHRHMLCSHQWAPTKVGNRRESEARHQWSNL